MTECAPRAARILADPGLYRRPAQRPDRQGAVKDKNRAPTRPISRPRPAKAWAKCVGKGARCSLTTALMTSKVRQEEDGEQRGRGSGLRRRPVSGLAAKIVAASGAPAPAEGQAPAQTLPAYICRKCTMVGEDCSPPATTTSAAAVSAATASAPPDSPATTAIMARNPQVKAKNAFPASVRPTGGIPAPSARSVPRAQPRMSANGYYCSTDGHNVCTPGTHYSRCDDDDECATGYCNTE